MIRALCLALSLFALPALAQGSDLSDAEVKERTETIGKTLRCVVCATRTRTGVSTFVGPKGARARARRRRTRSTAR